MTGVALQARDLARGFGRRRRVRAVAGVSFEAMAGEVVGLVGPNGAGKTTLLRLLAGRLQPERGTVTVNGVPARHAATRGLMGFAPDGPVFPPGLTVREVLEYYARLHAAGAALRGVVGAALELAALGDVAGRRAASLSRGYLQRLSLAQAVLGGPRVLLLDETLTGVDPIVRRALCDRLLELAGGGAAIVMSSHDLAAVERVAARVLVLVGGRVARAAPLAVVLGERVLEVILDRPVTQPPPGFRRTPVGLETDLGAGTVEAALAVCRAHRLVVRATRVRLRSLEDVVLGAADSAR